VNVSQEFKPFDQETDPTYNRKPGILKVPGSRLALEHEKFEQFPSDWGKNPGNPYVYREYPKMLYKAQHFQGKRVCMSPPPDPLDWPTRDKYKAAVEAVRRFNESCTRVVKNEAEESRSMEDGWRDSPEAAMEFIKDRDKKFSTEAAHREYDDRNMSEAAKKEIIQAKEAADGAHLAEVPRQPVRRARKVAAKKTGRRRGRPPGSKNKPKG
jgi:hypothetical protein